MASDYEAICRENRERYGTEGAKKTGSLTSSLYDDRTHFIYELLQNADDALDRRKKKDENRRVPCTVSFNLTPDRLLLSHYGISFDEADVRSVCDFGESTKDKDRHLIGNKGIGFKSVFKVTDFPEIHSGNEDFSIEEYVYPRQAGSTKRTEGETQIILPLKSEDETALKDIEEGFRSLGPSALLFLRHIEEINWSVQGGTSGSYMRSTEPLAPFARRITVIGYDDDKPDVSQDWLVFNRDLPSPQQEEADRVEIAFLLRTGEETQYNWPVQPVPSSPLWVFFPTVVPTYLGFLVQGPYRTTPARDNISQDNPKNRHLVKETAGLLLDAMRWMRGNEKHKLDVSVLRCLPLDRDKFPEGAMFAPFFETVRQAFLDEPLLPSSDGGYVIAGQAKLARGDELRKLFSPEQVSTLVGSKMSAWLTSDITQDRAPEIRRYLMQQLDIKEVTPETLIPCLSKEFLETQTDDWIIRLYEFLSVRAALWPSLITIPIPFPRLEDGTHVAAYENNEPTVFLPSNTETDFPTIRRAICLKQEVRKFLITLGIKEPSPVDDIIRNVLPKYQQNEVEVDDAAYAADIKRICSAYKTDSKLEREKLVSALSEKNFVMAVDTGNGECFVAPPSNIYISTVRLKQLFAGVPGVLIVDDEYDCLRGEDVRNLLEACDALRHLRPVKVTIQGAWGNKWLEELRKKNGYEQTSYRNDQAEDWELQGFDALIDMLPKLSPEERTERARLIWESLGELEDRRGRGIFDGLYTWTHHGKHQEPFPSAFIRDLNETPWVPDANGELVLPRFVVFESLGWSYNSFLLEKIIFKPPVRDQLAKEAGLEPGLIDLLLKFGFTRVADLKSMLSKLGINDPPPEDETEPGAEPEGTDDFGDDVYDAARDLYGDDMPDIPPGKPDPYGGDYAPGSAGRSGQGKGGAHGSSSGHSDRSGGRGERSHGLTGERQFLSYIGVHSGDEEPDPDGLDHENRMQVEEHAIALILKQEPNLQRTPAGNHGYDLFEVGSNGKKTRLVEVKSKTGAWKDRAVALSRKQFGHALKHREAFWLYVVEYATEPSKAHVYRIKNPAALARFFTFDSGWGQIANDDQQ
ncbi:MAG: DUF3883 domain-containing protein [Proteobacteria bacterium]|nr:DUF3883 domain-containing protein [Pseudomonadota bacterium]